jgi:tetratricopeptide (TPR) repeat protein
MHAANALLHALNALLFAWIAARLLAWRAADHTLERSSLPVLLGAGAAALLFALHPLRVESVAWATERRDVLSSCFLLGCVLAWLRLVRGELARGPGWTLVLVLYALSLLSKAWGMTLPVVLLLLDVWPLLRLDPERPRGRALFALALEKWPFVPLALFSAWKAAVAQGSLQATVGLAEHGVIERLVQACYGLAFYVWKTLVPSGLAPLYELEIDFDPTRPEYLAAVAFVVVTTSLLVAFRRRFPAGLAAWVQFAVIVSPVLGLLQSGAQRVADRYTYLACLPFALLAGAGLERLVRRGPQAARLALAGVGALCALLFALTWRQTQVWRDSETLWRHVLAIDPESYIAHHNLSVVLQQEGRIEEALASEQRSIEAHPGKGNEQSRHSLGNLYLRLGRRDDALAAFRGALGVAPTHMESIRSLVSLLRAGGDEKGALQVWRDAIAAEPGFMEGYIELALALHQSGRGLEAEDVLRAALEQRPSHAPALHALGVVVYQSGRTQEGEQLLRRALAADPRSPDTLTELAAVLSHRPETAGQAEQLLAQALQIAPGHARARQVAREMGVLVP